MDRQPGVPASPAGLASSLRVLEPAGQSTPVSSPARGPTRVITPNPSFLQPQSLEWDNLHEGLIGNPVRTGPLEGIDSLGWRKRASVTNPNLLEEGITALVSTDCSSLDILEQVGNIWTEKMANEGFNADLNQVKEIEQDVRDLMDYLRVSHVNVWKTKFVDDDLKKILDLAMQFRAEVRAFKRKYKETLTDANGLALDSQVTKLLDDVRDHAFHITNRA